MPRDLLADLDRQPLGQSSPLSSPSESRDQDRSGPFGNSNDTEASREEQEDAQAQDARIEAIKHLHPYAAILGLSDVESCLALEEATFPVQHRASREKVGLFAPSETETETNSEISQAVTAKTANTTDSNAPSRKGVLLAHIIATKTRNELVSDDDMKIPTKLESGSGSSDGVGQVGHQGDGRTIAIHSLAVLPGYQKKGLGTILMKEYIQRMVESETADRIAILTYEELCRWYTDTFGFLRKGQSGASFGGGEWVDMVLDFNDERIKQMNVNWDEDEEEEEVEEEVLEEVGSDKA